MQCTSIIKYLMFSRMDYKIIFKYDVTNKLHSLLNNNLYILEYSVLYEFESDTYILCL